MQIRAVRIFGAVLTFIWALDGMIAVNRWWTESMEAYLENITAMTLGFLLFSLLASRSRLDLVGFVILSMAIFYTGNYEIGGPSKFYLTPYDPLLGIKGVFEDGVWMGISSAQYRHTMTIATAFVAATILTISRLRGKSRKSQQAGLNEDNVIQGMVALPEKRWRS